MEFPSLGKQCLVQSCSQLDFLPFVCKYCKKIFCKEHNQPLNHMCAEYEEVVNAEPVNTEKDHYSCSFDTCKKWELTPVLCSACDLTFCLQHRHQTDHNCSKYVEPTDPKAAAAVVLNRIADQMSDKPRAISKKSEKTAAKVQLIKLKMKSVGTSSIPQENRLYFLVFLPKNSKQSKIEIFVSNSWSFGRVIDSIAEHAKIPNKNNILTADKLILFRRSDGARLSFNMSDNMNDLITQDIVVNGQSLILEFIPNGNTLSNVDNWDTYK